MGYGGYVTPLQGLEFRGTLYSQGVALGCILVALSALALRDTLCSQGVALGCILVALSALLSWRLDEVWEDEPAVEESGFVAGGG